jgi:hypothetical protein
MAYMITYVYEHKIYMYVHNIYKDMYTHVHV